MPNHHGRDGRGPVVVLSDAREAVAAIAAAFPEIDVVDVSRRVPSGIVGQVLFSTGNPMSVAAVSRGVRWVHWIGTGLDGVPDSLRNVDVFTNSRGANAASISEYVVAVMGAHARNFPDNWLRSAPSEWYTQPASTLQNATLGLFGFGAIGQRVARIALALEMSVVALRRGTGPSPVAGVRMATDWADLVADVDHLVLAAPATPATRHVVNAHSLRMVKPGAHLVNVARGSLVDHDPLRAALDLGLISRASLDVTEPEPVPDGHWLYEHPRVLLTPHSSWAGAAPLSGALEVFVRNLHRFLAGEPLDNVITGRY